MSFTIKQSTIDETREVCERDAKERDQKQARAEFQEFITALHDLEMMAEIMNIDRMKKDLEIIKKYLSTN
jgi:hypothetical protein